MTLASAFAAALSTTPSSVVVVGARQQSGPRLDWARSELGSEFAASFPHRYVTVEGGAARPAVAAGLRMGGKHVVTLIDDQLPLPLDITAQVMVTMGTDGLVLAARGAITAVQPVWADDVAPLLTAALSADVPLLLRLHAENLTAPAGGAPPPSWGVPRVLCTATSSLVVLGSGELVGLAVTVGRMLAGCGIEVSVIDRHTLQPGGDLDTTLADSHLFAGAPTVNTPLRPVAVAGMEPRAAMDAVLSALQVG